MSHRAASDHRPQCFGCRHFFITHEPAHPYGCRAMGFKSLQMPALVVHASSGLGCQSFAAKEKDRPDV